MRWLILLVLLLPLCFGCSREHVPCDEANEGRQWVEPYGRHAGALWECRKIWYCKHHTAYHLQWVRITPDQD